MIPEFQSFLSRLTLHEPQIPLLSNVTGTWMSASEATNPATWARQIRATVRFSDELDVLLSDPGSVLVEVGPGGALTASAMRHPRWSNGHRAVRLMRHQAQNRNDRDTFLLALGQLWSAGIDVDWTPLFGRSTAATRFASRLSLCAATALGGAQANRRVGGGWRCDEWDEWVGGDTVSGGHCHHPCGRKRRITDGSDVAANLGAVPRRRLDRPQRQLLRTRW